MPSMTKAISAFFILQCLYGTDFPRHQILMAKSDQIPAKGLRTPTEVVCSRGVPLVACCPYNAASEFLDLGATHRRCPSLRLNVDNIQTQSIFFDKPIYAYGFRGISATASITRFYQQLDDDSLEHRRSLALWSWHRPTDCQPPSKHSILICLSRCGGLRSARTTLHDRLRSTLTSGRI